LFGLHSSQALVFKAEVNQGIARDTGFRPVSQALLQKTALARPPNPDNGMCLAGYGRHPGIPARQFGQLDYQTVGQFLSNHISHLSLF
jgi:hypothetical protein